VPVVPTQDQIDEINELIQNALDDEANGLTKSAAKNKQRAIGKADKYFQIGGNTAGEPKYDPGVDGEGETHPVKGRAKVKIGDAAFVDPDGKPSAAWLASTKIHEILGHGAQIKRGNGWIHPGDYPEDEVEAYNKELEFAKTTGLSQAQIDDVKERKKEEFNRMPKDRQDEWKKREPWLAVAKGGPPAKKFYTARSNVEHSVGRFALPNDMELFGQGGQAITVAKGTSLAAAAGRLTRGELGTLLKLNPALSISMAAFHAILSGDIDKAAAHAQSPRSVVLVPPPVTPGGLLATESAEQPHRSKSTRNETKPKK
jgi:hypothetical protein